jgi:hypothetical protein
MKIGEFILWFLISGSKKLSVASLMVFIQLCEPCERKRHKQERKIVYRPIISKNFNERVQIDLIDWQSVSDSGEFKHILTYIDHFTGFTQLRALPNRSMVTVVDTIRDIFYVLDAPRMIQTDNGREFKNDRMKQMLSEFGTIHIRGTPKHSQSSYVKRLGHFL